MDAHFFKEMQDTLLTLCPSKWWPNPVHNGAYQAWKNGALNHLYMDVNVSENVGYPKNAEKRKHERL